jgi:Biotin-lipoyl like/HlyD family secretion protein
MRNGKAMSASVTKGNTVIAPQIAGQPVILDVPRAVGGGPKPNTEPSAVVILLRVEGEARAARSVNELALLIANETRKLTRSQQVFVLGKAATGGLQVEAASSMTAVDRQIPLIQWIERTVGRAEADVGLAVTREFTLQSYGETTDPLTSSYPFREALWFPLCDRTGALFAGVLVLRGEPWTSAETVLAQRLSVTFAQAWYWIATSKSVRPKFQISRKRAITIALMSIAVCLFPVSMTTLAPFEIGARDPSVITAPIDGVIQDIPVASNSVVAIGDVLVRFSDTILRNRLEVAERELQVADARIKKNMLLAMTDIRGRHELALARSELTVKTAERDYARELLDRAQITATRSGIAIFGDKRDLVGKPISTGERIMEIADPKQVEIRVDVPVADSIILSDDKRAKIFLDSDPLRPREATIVHGDYQAKMREGGNVAFRVVATFADPAGQPPRLGIRGTAQLYGDRVPLMYYLLRRPLAVMRQWTGL